MLISLIGFILLLALPLASLIPQLSEIWRKPAGRQNSGSGSPEPSMSPIPGVRDELESLKLPVQPSQGVAGEPIPIGVTVRGRTDGAVVVVRGLLPGMELSAGLALAGAAWQLSTSDLQYAWVAAPNKEFVGSDDLVAELRLPNAQTADRQTVSVEWMRPPPSSQPEPEHIAPPREIEPAQPINPTEDQHQDDADFSAGPQAAPSQDQLPRRREQSKNVRAHAKTNSRRSVSVGSPPAISAKPPVREGTDAPKGFWDWSR